MTKTLELIKYMILMGILAISLVNTSVSAAVQVTIDRNPVYLNESFRLIFKTDTNPDQAPDFSGLESLFSILHKNQSHSVNITNSGTQQSVEWILQMMPKKEGDFIVPSIPFGSDKTEPFLISVKPANQRTISAQDGLMMELITDKSEVYVQGQMLVTLRLMVDRSIAGYQMSDLTFNNMDVVIEPLGEIKQYQTTQGNKAYLVLEKRMALFPQQSGKLEINPVVGEVQELQNNSLFGSTRGKNIQRVQSKSASIDVLPIASASTAAHWLPATQITLTEDWQHDTTQLIAGEPVTRTITLVANGQTAAQLPKLVQTPVNGIKLYPDQPLLSDKKSESGIIGTHQQKLALIPTAAGTYTLPELTVNWWDVNTGKQQQARLPSRTIEVKAGLNTATHTANPQPLLQTPANPSATAGTKTNYLWIGLSFILALGWVITAFIWYTKHRRVNPAASGNKTNPQHSKNLNQRQALERLTESCTQNHPQNTRHALLAWAKSLDIKQTFTHLNDVGLYFGEPLQTQIAELNYSLYGGNTEDWTGGELLRCCQSLSANSNKNKADDGSNNLCALNP